ncbi:glycine betaine ABC transporter substrate-binding protein [Terrilactibacillus laevilacticus]|uniref:Glycine betaine ABC transporter substrate-binding protein n=1 Tax=Terrilactibacillus laevilacticus TaxID=1380157 RepID=A0ABW5PPC5_9BACI|nr:glycine betaine ABC transporter substrate-binding protein [Terrilactibacillus laevilacticus]
MKKISLSIVALFVVIGMALSGCGSNGNDKNKSVGDQTNHTITGIDPGSGIMKATDKVIKDYNLNDWKVQSGSEATMTASLDKAIKNKKPIIITGWTPHWMFSKYDLKYLKDPKGVYGKNEEIHTVINKNFAKKDPNATKFLDQFTWSPEDMGKVMLDIQNGKSEQNAAKAWIKANQDKVKQWTNGVNKVNGKTVKLAYVSWASEIASTNVVAEALRDLGYKVNLEQLGAGQMFAGLAKGSDDAIVAAWLPSTHADYMNEFKNKLTDLGPNLKGTKLGLVVPKYMKINSIEDLKTK